VKPRTHKNDSLVIVYDADSVEQAGPQLFDEDSWRQNGGLVGLAQGRGRALLLETSFGPAVLRRYLRGGWAARFSRDRYLFTGYGRSRPVLEFHMLARLRERGLPVPHPLAAECMRDGVFYTGSLMTRRITDVVPLADLLGSDEVDHELWRATGACIRRFHDNGVVHADLNARNILVQRSGHVHLIDFDRARINSGAGRSFESNLRRLRRSLDKLWPASRRERLESCWSCFLEAYRAGPGSFS
jgi:3-deoxy-D-manno-octulosonic acid kinase